MALEVRYDARTRLEHKTPESNKSDNVYIQSVTESVLTRQHYLCSTTPVLGQAVFGFVLFPVLLEPRKLGEIGPL